MQLKEKIKKQISKLPHSEQLKLIQSIYNELQKANSIRILSGEPVKVDAERPDLLSMK